MINCIEFISSSGRIAKDELDMEIINLNNEYQKKNIFLVLTAFCLNLNFYGGILLFLYPTYSKTKYL